MGVYALQDVKNLFFYHWLLGPTDDVKGVVTVSRMVSLSSRSRFGSSVFQEGQKPA